MARTVNQARHEARRLLIIDAAFTVFAAQGYEGATTAAICREAGIGSGTLFHYFPTKLSILLAILEYGTLEVRERATAQEERGNPLAAILDHVAGGADDATDPRLAGFVRAVGGVLGKPEVAAALDADSAAQRSLLVPWIERGQACGQIRGDLPVSRLASWIQLFTDGFLERAASDPQFSPQHEKSLLLDAVHDFLRPRAEQP